MCIFQLNHLIVANPHYVSLKNESIFLQSHKCNFTLRTFGHLILTQCYFLIGSSYLNFCNCPNSGILFNLTQFFSTQDLNKIHALHLFSCFLVFFNIKQVANFFFTHDIDILKESRPILLQLSDCFPMMRLRLNVFFFFFCTGILHR